MALPNIFLNIQCYLLVLLFASLMISLHNVQILTILMIIKMMKRTMMMMMMMMLHLVNRKFVLLNLHIFHLVSIWQRVDYELCHSTFCFTLWTKLFQKYTEDFPRSAYCLAFETRHGESVKFSTNNNLPRKVGTQKTP